MRLTALAAVLALVLAACAAPPKLVIGETVAGDFAVVATDLWDDFTEFADARLDCFDDVTLQASTTLEDRAAYEPPTRTIWVQVPRSIESLRESLVHELAHHVERACPAHVEGRARFLEAMGVPAATPWFESDRWSTTPSERWAEATVELVVGTRERSADVLLSDEELVAVAKWWGGE